MVPLPSYGKTEDVEPNQQGACDEKAAYPADLRYGIEQE